MERLSDHTYVKKKSGSETLTSNYGNFPEPKCL